MKVKIEFIGFAFDYLVNTKSAILLYNTWNTDLKSILVATFSESRFFQSRDAAKNSRIWLTYYLQTKVVMLVYNRMLVSALSGTPLYEITMVKETNETHTMQKIKETT